MKFNDKIVCDWVTTRFRIPYLFILVAATFNIVCIWERFFTSNRTPLPSANFLAFLKSDFTFLERALFSTSFTLFSQKTNERMN